MTYGPGDVIGGRFRLRSLLGTGGFAKVWLAEALDAKGAETGELVALKLLVDHPSKSPERFLRFKTEQRVLRRLDHRRITRFLVGDMESEPPYLAMEFIDGVSLHDAIRLRARRHDPFSFASVIRIGQQIADALEHAHERGVVHRDLKPANVMILNGSADGIKVLDFGIAKLTRDVRGDVTTDNRNYGTSMYLAPEQFFGQTEADPRSDLFSAAAILFELATGRKAWVWDTAQVPVEAQDADVLDTAGALATMARIMHKPMPKAREFRPDFPEAFDRVLSEMSTKKREDRLRHAGLLRRALDQLGGAPSAARTQEETPLAELMAGASAELTDRVAKLFPAPGATVRLIASSAAERGAALAFSIRDPAAAQPVTFVPELPVNEVRALLGFLANPAPDARLEARAFLAELKAADGELGLSLIGTAQELKVVLSSREARGLEALLGTAINWFDGLRRDARSATTLREEIGETALSSYVWRARTPAPTPAKPVPTPVPGPATLELRVLRAARPRLSREDPTAVLLFRLKERPDLFVELPCSQLGALAGWLAQASERGARFAAAHPPRSPGFLAGPRGPSKVSIGGISHNTADDYLVTRDSVFVGFVYEYDGLLDPFFHVEVLLRDAKGRKMELVMSAEAAGAFGALVGEGLALTTARGRGATDRSVGRVGLKAVGGSAAISWSDAGVF
jgi:hypothetical protein